MNFQSISDQKKNSINHEKKGSFKKAFLVYRSYFRLSFFYSRNQRHISWIFLIRICRSNYSSLQGARCLASNSLPFCKNLVSNRILVGLDDPILRLEQPEDQNIRQDLKSFMKNIIKINSLFLDFAQT